MSKKISELTDATTLDGSEQIELVQAGGNVKVTVNDLLPVQLQESKIIDINGKVLNIQQLGNSILMLDGTTDAERSELGSRDSTGDGNVARIALNTPTDYAEFRIQSNFNDGTKSNEIFGYSNATESEISYTAGQHIFSGINEFADDAAAATGGVDVNGLYHTAGIIKIRRS